MIFDLQRQRRYPRLIEPPRPSEDEYAFVGA